MIHLMRQSSPQEYEVGVDASCLSGAGDGVTADFSAGSRAGHFTLLTATAALDPQRRSYGAARMGCVKPYP